MPDIQQFFEIVARLLKPNGSLLMYEIHPVLEMFEPSEKDDPHVEEDGLDYYGKSKYKSAPEYSFPHKLSAL